MGLLSGVGVCCRPAKDHRLQSEPPTGIPQMSDLLFYLPAAAIFVLAVVVVWATRKQDKATSAIFWSIAFLALVVLAVSMYALNAIRNL